MKIYRDHWIPKLLKINGITLPFGVFINCPDEYFEYLLAHELIHCRQIESVGMFKFYIKYLWEYFYNLCKYKNHKIAYRNISFEIEAYFLINKKF